MIAKRISAEEAKRTRSAHELTSGRYVNMQGSRWRHRLYFYFPPILLTLFFSMGTAVGAATGTSTADVGLLPAVAVRHVAATTFFSLEAAPGGTRIAVGESGIIARSTNGEEWVQSASPVSRTLTAVIHVDGSEWLAVGWDGIVVKSQDDGVTWSVKRAVAENTLGLPVTLLGVYFQDARNGLSVGTGGTLLTTSDAGETWSEQILKNEDGMEVHLCGVTMSNGRAIITGEAGAMFVREPMSDVWNVVKGSNKKTLFGVTAHGDRVFAYGLLGTAFVSTNGGVNWESVASPSSRSWFGAAFLDGGALVVVGAKGSVGYLAAGSTEIVDLKGGIVGKIPELENFMDVLYIGEGKAVIASIKGLVPLTISNQGMTENVHRN